MSQENVDNVEKKATPVSETSASTAQAKNKDKGKGNKKRNPLVQMLLSLLTLGAFSRFSPRNKDKKGGWGVTVIILTLVCAALVGERFYKQEINELAKQQLQIEADIIPETLPFEAGGSEEAKAKKEEDNKKLLELESQHAKLEKELAEAKDKLASYSNSSSETESKVAEIKAKVSQLEREKAALDEKVKLLTEELSAAKEALQQEKSKVPTINFSSIKSASEEVGCKTSYSEERANDLFAKEYKGHWAEWTGFVKSANKEQVEIVSKEDSKDVAVIRFEKEGAGYYLLKGQEITMRFILENNASCKEPFFGHTGFEIKE